MALAWLACPHASQAIPVFARIYDQPCSACHTTYPQLNPAGESFRLNGLHGFTPKIEPLRFGRWFELPRTLPVAVAMAVGGDYSKVNRPGTPTPTEKHYNLEFFSLLVGAELGPHLAFLGDYAPLFHNTRTGELKRNKDPGLAFLQIHGAEWGHLFNLKAGLFELPFSVSPRVHRLSVQPYLTYGQTAFSLLGVKPPNGSRADTLALGATQFGIESSAHDTGSGRSFALGLTSGSNNKTDNNSSMDVYVRAGQQLGFHRAGLLAYYSPDVLGGGVVDSALRFGPDVALYFRRLMILGQFLAARDSNPTTFHESLWWFAGFVEANFRVTPTIVALLRPEAVKTTTFDDTDAGGATRVRKHLWQITGGVQWLVLENLKLLTEGTYGENSESLTDRTTDSWAITVRLHTSFWPLTPPGLDYLRPAR